MLGGGEQILGTRRAHMSNNQSISYLPNPLVMVEGKGSYLYDDRGKEYLDCVNNVAHVGHCHPRVVAATNEQMAKLNTNTRYLHPKRVEYVSRLNALFPDPLNVFFFVCSGSEANDLALRLARTYTKQNDVVVVGGGYHGNLSSMVELSPYKYEGPGGFQCKDHVHKAPAPDTYRGPYRRDDPHAGKKYAELVEKQIAEMQAAGRSVAAFYCESILSCAGQIVLPPDYLTHAYRAVRGAGGVCVADEVQVGFGRVGEHMWGFEAQGVIPDIVTLGKPIGNGYPMSCVVTTREIADAFSNGMEYFNTFGGSTAAMATGVAVLDVIRDEQLQSNALEIGSTVAAGLRSLQAQHPHLIGDVRGMGLFLGLELVRDSGTLEPAAEEAAYIAQHMRMHGRVLVSTDGPMHNVIKLKPPLCFGQTEARKLLEAFGAAFTALAAKEQVEGVVGP